MANLTETAVYDAGVYQIETTDPVSGGATGIANKPLINLANRTAFLNGKVNGILAGTETLSGYAKLASPTFTGNPVAPTPALGDSDTSIATTEFVQKTLGGVLSKSVAGGANVTLTAVEAGNGILVFTGALTASISVIVPTAPTRPWVVFNNTTGAFTLTVKTASGTGVAVPQGKREIVYCDGTNVAPAFSDFVNVALEGVPTAPTAETGTSTTQVATTAFVNAQLGNSAAPASHVGATGAAHGAATTSVNGFMSAADKTKLDGIAAGAAALGSTVGTALGTAAAGTATTAARSDHVHPTDTTRAPRDSPTFTGTPAAPTAAAGTNTTQLATTAFVQTAVSGVTSPVTSVAGKTGAVTLTASDVGLSNVANVDQRNASNLTSGTVGAARLPAGSTSAAGIVQLSSSTSSTSTTLAATASAVKDAYDAAMSDDAVSKAENGYVKLRSGVIIQWGTTTITVNGRKSVTLPISFPTAGIALMATGNSTTTGEHASNCVYGQFTSTSTFTICQIQINAYLFSSAYWVAIGY